MTDQLVTSTNGTGSGSDVVDQPTYDKGSWLNGATDLEEADVYVEPIQTWVKVRGLSAGEQGRITDQCLSMKGDVAKIDSQRMGVLKFAAGVVEPSFDENEANVINH